MSILSGYKKFKRYVLTDNGYQLCSQWTSSNTIHFDDGNTAQTKVGAINGISDSLTATNSNIALSVNAGKTLQDQITKLNTDLMKVFYNITPIENAYVIVSGIAYKTAGIHIFELNINIKNPIPAWNNTLCAKIDDWDGSTGRILVDSLGGINPAFYLVVEPNGNMTLVNHEAIGIAGWAYADGCF